MWPETGRVGDNEAVNKDASILRLLDRISQELDPKTWRVVDHWDADLLAIGIAAATNPELLVYISTHRQPEGHFSFECEVPSGSAGMYRVVDRAESVNFDALLLALSTHFKRTPGA